MYVERGEGCGLQLTRPVHNTPLRLCGSWSLTERLRNDQLRTFHRRCVRDMCPLNIWHVQQHRITAQDLEMKRLDICSFETYHTWLYSGYSGYSGCAGETVPRTAGPSPVQLVSLLKGGTSGVSEL
jgi:hypothetical protein